MPEIEVELPDRIDGEIDRLVDQGDFLNRERAVEELLQMGMSAFDTGSDDSDETAEADMFTNTVDEQTDPAMQDDLDDEYTF